MELPVVSALEFEQLKSSIKTFIKTKTDFKDYDFEGSNLSMLVDVLAYNTLYTSYNVSMAANELNLDTAVFRDNVVSIAKRLGYNPNSYTSSKVSVNITVNNTQNFDSIRLEPGPILAASAGGQNFTFILRDNLEINVKGKQSVTFPKVELLEGSDFSISYTVDTSNEHQRFFIPNSFVDAESIRVFVVSDPSTNKEEEYKKKTTIVDVSATSKIFFVEEVQDQKYEVIFGDDVFGRKLRDGEIIRIQYVISSGSQSNNIRIFDFVGTIQGRTNNIESVIGTNNVQYTITSEFSDGGSEFEDIRSIKYAAPRYYASQERTVTVSDYESVIKQIYPNADLVKVVGGESLTPPRFGKVFISIKPFVGETVSTSEKQRIIKELSKYKVGSVDVEILDPFDITIIAKPIATYDASKTRNTQADMISLINGVFIKYTSDINFNSFGGKYSDLEVRCLIKDVDEAIQFTKVPIYLQQNITLYQSVENFYEIDFYTKLKKDGNDEYYVLSDPFCVQGIASPVVLGAKSGCETESLMYLYYLNGTPVKSVGKIDMNLGKITFTLTACQNAPINITVIPEITDILFGPNVVPSLVLLQPEIADSIEDLDTRSDLLNNDQSILPVQEILSNTAEGDPNALVDPTVTPNLISAPGGSIVPPSSVTIIQPSDGQVIIDPFISDPNNISTIDDYTPEQDPYSCP